MPTHTIEVTGIPDELLKQLDDRIRERGGDRAAYVRKLIAKDLKTTPTLSEVLAPFRRQVEEGGITDEELDTLFEEAREEVYREKQAKA